MLNPDRLALTPQAPTDPPIPKPRGRAGVSLSPKRVKLQEYKIRYKLRKAGIPENIINAHYPLRAYSSHTRERWKTPGGQIFTLNQLDHFQVVSFLCFLFEHAVMLAENMRGNPQFPALMELMSYSLETEEPYYKWDFPILGYAAFLPRIFPSLLAEASRRGLVKITNEYAQPFVLTDKGHQYDKRQEPREPQQQPGIPIFSGLNERFLVSKRLGPPVCDSRKLDFDNAFSRRYGLIPLCGSGTESGSSDDKGTGKPDQPDKPVGGPSVPDERKSFSPSLTKPRFQPPSIGVFYK